MNDQRICSKCKQSRLLSQFFKDKTTKSGLASSCKVCRKEYNNKTAEYRRLYKAQNPAKPPTEEQKAKYNLNRRERRKEKADHVRKVETDWRIKNPEKRRNHARRDYLKHRRERIEAAKKWRDLNRAHYRAIQAKRRAGKLSATPTWLTNLHNEQLKMFYAAASAYNAHVDHIVPLQGKDVCGLHVPWNLQVIDSSSNISKRNKLTKEGEQLAWTPVSLKL